MLGQRAGDRLVAPGAVRPVVGGHVHPLGADGAGRLHHPPDRVAADDLEAAVAALAVADRGVQRPQRVAEVEPPRDAGGTPERGVEDEEREHRSRRPRASTSAGLSPSRRSRRNHITAVIAPTVSPAWWARYARRGEGLDRWATMQR